MNNSKIEQRAKEIREQHGGRIFSFPIHEEDPYSKYIVAIHLGNDQYNIYPEALSIEEAAAGIMATLEGFKEEGWDDDYERNVRFISHEAQMDSPNLTMRRLKKANVSRPLLELGVDMSKKEDDPEEYLISGRGLVKWTYIEMVDSKNAKAIRFMNEYYKLLAMRKYGKTAAAIKQEVRRMTKEQAVEWIEKTYKRYIPDSSEIFNIMNIIS